MPNPIPTAEPALLLGVSDVARLLGVSTRHIWRMCDANQFPAPVAVGARLKRWPRSAVVSWIEAQSATARH